MSAPKGRSVHGICSHGFLAIFAMLWPGLTGAREGGETQVTSHCRHERRRTARMLLRARRAAQGINAFRGKVGSQQGLKMSRKGRECVKWSEKWEPLGRKG